MDVTNCTDELSAGNVSRFFFDRPVSSLRCNKETRILIRTALTNNISPVEYVSEEDE